MDIAITQGRITVDPIPPYDAEAPEGSRAGYMLNVQDGQSGITLRVSMGYAEAAQLGAALVKDTEAHPEWKAAERPNIEVVQSLPHALPTLPDGEPS